MSWKDRIENSIFKITTGDGKSFSPLWKGSDKSTEFNNNVYNFIDVEKSFVDRKQLKSPKYTLVFYFQGDDYIDISEDFENSAKDKRYWIVDHPIYGTINGQPLSIGRNDSYLNIVEFSVEFWETNEVVGLKTTTSIKSTMENDLSDCQDICAEDYAGKVNIEPIDQSNMTKNINDIWSDFSSFLSENYSEVILAKNKCLSSIDLVTDNDLLTKIDMMKDVVSLIQIPAKIEGRIFEKINILKNAFNSVLDMLDEKSSNKSYFEAVAGNIVATMCFCATNINQNEIFSRIQVFELSEVLSEYYNLYLAHIDDSQVILTDVNSSYTASFLSQNIIYTIVTNSIANLGLIAFNSLQEREILLHEDSNLIILCHRYFGLDDFDENLTKFKLLNDIKNRNLFNVKRGRKIKYLV